MTSIQATDRPLRADARRNRERILDAARRVFADGGAEAQMDDVAAQAGVGVGTVYRHFPTKEALMGELVRQKFERFVRNAQKALAAGGEPFDAFADLLRANAKVMARDAATQHVLMSAGEQVFAYSEAERTELLELAGELIARAQRAGTLRSDFAVAEIPMLMCGLSATMGQPGYDWRRHLELLLDALRVR